MPAAPLSRRTLLIGAGALALATACAPARTASQAADTVTTTYGPVRGVRRTTGTAFLDIPYAQPPVGELRFAAPAPPTPWRETRDCTAYGPTAQRKQLGEVTAIPEPSIPGDGILNLNVFTPDPTAKLPVLVWIHGGGFVAGSAASPWYDGASFNRDGVVVVSVGYRLGVQGFLHVEGAPDNRAVLDWIAALRWVRDNIDRFGGDPDRVTVAGQSAGGGAVWALMAAPSAKGLFRAGISASGAVSQPNERAEGIAVSQLFTERTGTPATVAALRDLSDDRILALQDQLGAPGTSTESTPVLALAPFADGTLIPQSSTELLKSGAAMDIPLMLGFTRDEFNAMTRDQPATDATLTPAFAAMGLAPADVDAFRTAYPGDTPAQLIGQAQSDLLLRGPSYRVAEARASRGIPTWFYEFSWASTAPEFTGLSSHCLDIPFAFDLLQAQGVTTVAGENPPQSLADALHRTWVAFITDLDPGPTWPRYTLDRRDTMMWSDSPHVQADPFAAQRAIWLH
ncbi:carboxylesterase family protein [Nocardia uniformis]|uniref:Carboxylic ester hydrolase n=1 Tax=Nocardia uniformis TaxID=53432 RepID=A0A849C8N2_9NOCA|nr:carboxylesterase family protein [Nocardia uniformis]NNH72247.1 carboxylesterase family protein [Nocardia uniformis]